MRGGCKVQKAEPKIEGDHGTNNRLTWCNRGPFELR